LSAVAAACWPVPGGARSGLPSQHQRAGPSSTAAEKAITTPSLMSPSKASSLITTGAMFRERNPSTVHTGHARRWPHSSHSNAPAITSGV
jgi:hypothetical protein